MVDLSIFFVCLPEGNAFGFNQIIPDEPSMSPASTMGIWPPRWPVKLN